MIQNLRTEIWVFSQITFGNKLYSSHKAQLEHLQACITKIFTSKVHVEDWVLRCLITLSQNLSRKYVIYQSKFKQVFISIHSSLSLLVIILPQSALLLIQKEVRQKQQNQNSNYEKIKNNIETLTLQSLGENPRNLLISSVLAWPERAGERERESREVDVSRDQ